MIDTTYGQAKVLDGYVVIEFGVLHLDEPEWPVETVVLNVDGYAKEIARDLLVAICEQAEAEGDQP